jgi:preprotein translocase subunit YajC
MLKVYEKILLRCFMSILNLLGISDAIADTTATANPPLPAGGSYLMPLLLFAFIVGSYFLIVRPQNKRIKAQRKLIADLAKGDEVVTAGGIVGKIVKISDDFITISIAENVDINVQKAAVTNVLPKGTIKSL